MEFVYVVSFNSSTGNWSVEDESSYLGGNVWDSENQEWSWPNDGYKELINERCHNMLNALIPIWPTVDTEPV